MPATFKGKSRRNSGKRGGNRGGSAAGPSAAALTYNGPMVPKQSNQQTIIRPMALLQALSSDATGSIKTFIVIGVTSCPGWSQLAGQYSEYRVVSCRLRWIPLYTTYSTTSTPVLASTLVIGLVRDASITPYASATLAMNQWPKKFASIMQPQMMDYRMSGAAEALWLNTDSPIVACSYTLNADGLTASSVYGNYSLELNVQFRNPGA